VKSTPLQSSGKPHLRRYGQDPEHGEGVGILTCIDATKTGDVTKTAKVWEYRGIHRSISTVSLDPNTGLIFVGDFSGFVHCLDAETGKVYWTHDMKAHMWGSTFVADGKLYVGDEDGDFVCCGNEGKRSSFSETNVGAALYAHHRRQRRDLHPIQHTPLRLL